MSTQRLTIHKERGHLWTEAPDRPGCYATGRDLPELLDATAEAVRLYDDAALRALAATRPGMATYPEMIRSGTADRANVVLVARTDPGTGEDMPKTAETRTAGRETSAAATTTPCAAPDIDRCDECGGCVDHAGCTLSGPGGTGDCPACGACRDCVAECVARPATGGDVTPLADEAPCVDCGQPEHHHVDGRCTAYRAAPPEQTATPGEPLPPIPDETYPADAVDLEVADDKPDDEPTPAPRSWWHRLTRRAR